MTTTTISEQITRLAIEAAAVRHLDTLTVKHTGFSSFADTLTTHASYRPSFYTSPRPRKSKREAIEENLRASEILTLANAYDIAQQMRWDARVSFRGN